MPRNQEITTSEFYCTKCGKKGIPIARRVGKQREAGHLKRIYCLNCKRDWNFAEVRPFGEYDYEDFEIEYNYNNFDEEGNRIIPFKQFIAKIREEFEDE